MKEILAGLLTLLVFLQHFQVVNAHHMKCQRTFSKMGCFDTYQNRKRIFEELIVTDRDSKAPEYSGIPVDWFHWEEYLLGLVCRCMTRLSRISGANLTIYQQFSISNYGECWSSRDGLYFVTSHKRANSCVGAGYMECKTGTEAECSGAELSSFVYQVINRTEVLPDHCHKMVKVVCSSVNVSAKSLPTSTEFDILPGLSHTQGVRQNPSSKSKSATTSSLQRRHTDIPQTLNTRGLYTPGKIPRNVTLAPTQYHYSGHLKSTSSESDSRRAIPTSSFLSTKLPYSSQSDTTRSLASAKSVESLTTSRSAHVQTSDFGISEMVTQRFTLFVQSTSNGAQGPSPSKSGFTTCHHASPIDLISAIYKSRHTRRVNIASESEKTQKYDLSTYDLPISINEQLSRIHEQSAPISSQSPFGSSNDILSSTETLRTVRTSYLPYPEMETASIPASAVDKQGSLILTMDHQPTNSVTVSSETKLFKETSPGTGLLGTAIEKHRVSTNARSTTLTPTLTTSVHSQQTTIIEKDKNQDTTTMKTLGKTTPNISISNVKDSAWSQVMSTQPRSEWIKSISSSYINKWKEISEQTTGLLTAKNGASESKLLSSLSLIGDSHTVSETPHPLKRTTTVKKVKHPSKSADYAYSRYSVRQSSSKPDSETSFLHKGKSATPALSSNVRTNCLNGKLKCGNSASMISCTLIILLVPMQIIVQSYQ